MNHLRFALLSSSVAVTLAAAACGGISDPTRGGEGRVATVSGALTGIAVPANARVALVYRKVTTSPGQPTVEVGSDVAVVGGKFTMNLGLPSADYFSSIEGRSFSGSSGDDAPVATPPAPNTSPPAPSNGSSTSGSGGAAFGIGTKLAPRDVVSGQINEPISAALAGFIVYADTNGNGKLDLEGQYASSPDQILGGNNELVLVYLKGGGTLDYEKLRDKSSILPVTGFNLAWSEGRWLPLNLVELKLTSSASLPRPVCDPYSYSSGSDGIAPSPEPVAKPGLPGSSGGGSGGGTATDPGYPSPSDPSLSCSPDGRAFSYNPPVDCPPSAPQPVGLCAGGGGVYETTGCAGSGGYGSSLKPGDAVPAGWPCPAANDVDGGAVDGGAFDAGSADGG